MPSGRAAGVRAGCFLHLFFFLLFGLVAAIETVPGSPCAEQCAGNLNNETVCLDTQFSTLPGSRLRDCTSCLLNSTAVDPANNVSDVEWGLFNLRYIVSECIYAYPREIVSTSNPCQVTCAPLQPAITYQIQNNVENAVSNVVPNLDFCQNNFGNDNIINNCTFCYTFVPQQLYLGNFMQALHIACRQPPTLGQTFYPNGQAIFNGTAIAGPAPPSSNTSKSSGLTGWKLGLVIALPVVGGTALFATSCFCCFRFTKKRRQRMAASGRMSRFHDGITAHSATTYSSPVTGRTPPTKFEWPSPQAASEQEMETIHYVHTPKSGKDKSPGMAQGRWSMHGRTEHEPEPLSALPRDDVGPGENQTKDPYLHDQYFGETGAIGQAVQYPAPQSYPVPTLHAAPRPADRRSWGQQ